MYSNEQESCVVGSQTYWMKKNRVQYFHFPCCRFSDLLDEEESSSVFEEEYAGIGHYVLDGLVGRTKTCKLTTLDFTDMPLRESDIDVVCCNMVI